MHNLPCNFEMPIDHLILPRRKKIICRFLDFTFPEDQRVKIKENEEVEQYLNFARELKLLWNMRVREIPIIVDMPRTVPRSLKKRLKELDIKKKITYKP